jgi:hypothetical protein
MRLPGKGRRALSRLILEKALRRIRTGPGY